MLASHERGFGRPLALRPGEHDGSGFPLQRGKHTSGVLIPQDAEHDGQRTPPVHLPYRRERRLDPSRVVPPIQNHGHPVYLVRLEPPG